MKLKIPSSQKKAIISIFLLGSFVCIASIMRLVAVLTQGTDADVSWNWVNQAIWATVEADLAIVSVRRRLVNSQASNQSDNPPATPPIRTQGPSWATRILKSNSDDNEEVQPFSIISHAEESSYHHSTVDNLCTETRVGIPLSTVKKEVPNDQEGITVQTAWNVECNQYNHSNV
ncbi:hypothetical protein N7528_005864 [Penicillium herquei]|nr:hypothetical protein N7528_005864 [Penicillium herquei]